MITSIIKWAALALLGLMAVVVNVLMSPLIALFIGRDGYLPGWLTWFQTHDNPAIGDKAFQSNQMPWTLVLPGWLARYFLGIGWALRNPAYGYDRWAGFEVKNDNRLYAASGNEGVDIYRDAQGKCHVVEGWCLREVIIDCDKYYFQFTVLRRWSTSRAWRVSIGWTLSKWELRRGNVCRLNTTINPWMDCRDGTT
ncbi:hypothetical protein [Ferriphaselus sp. R-1]|uniref:DUF7338 family protein n=1 Tax=Ferriphaselus sp. R-1 TaxID=1485544 RepID=UPI000550CD4F|nr:hypothetical protein [Ferriphaselus sp. R-1]